MNHGGSYFSMLGLATLLHFFLAVSSALGQGKLGGWEYESNYPLEFGAIQIASNKDSVYVLGTFYDNQFANEQLLYRRIWALNATSLEWKPIITSGDIPPRMVFYSLCSYKDSLILFGGRLSSGSGDINDMYLLDLKTMTWKKEIYSPSVPPPSKRELIQSGAYSDKVYIYGGFTGSSSTELWSYDFNSKIWTSIVPSEDNSKNAPTVHYTQMSPYKESMVIIAGFNSKSVLQSMMWRFNITENMWRTPVTLPNFNPVVFGSSNVYGDSIYLFGGAYDSARSKPSSDVIIVNLITNNVEYVYGVKPSYLSTFPIITPSPRYYASSAFVGDKLIVSGAVSYCFVNDFWVFDTVTKTWTNSSLSLYPLTRRYPHISKISETEISFFGGEACYSSYQPINDMWTYHTESKKWELVHRESLCLPTQSNCPPAVLYAAFGYWNGTAYLIGGFYKDFFGSTMLKFSFATKKWSPLTILDSKTHTTMGMRYRTAYAVKNEKIMMWGGQNSNSSVVVNPAIFVLDMNDMEGYSVVNTTNIPSPRAYPQGVIIKNQFCFTDYILTYTKTPTREIWCWEQQSNAWKRISTVPKSVPDYSVTLGFEIHYFVFGGLNQQGYFSGDFWINDVDSGEWSALTGQETTAPGRAYSTSIILSGKIYMFGGDELSDTTNGIYSLELDKLWCRGTTYVTSNDGRISDGSGNFKYFPGSECTWIVSHTNYLVIEQMKLSKGATLLLETVLECDGLISYNKTQSKRVDLSSLKNGASIFVASGNTRLSFKVSTNGVPDEGFSIKLFNCKAGFHADLSGCICSAGNFINFGGDCLPCPSGTYQTNQNQNICIDTTVKNITKEIPTVKQSESIELSVDLPPIIFGNAAFINPSIYVLGGSVSSDVNDFEMYHPMDVIYSATSSANSKWSRMEVDGDIPAPRIQSCFVSMGNYGVLVGGKTSKTDHNVYHFDALKRKWKIVSEAPQRFIGSQCIRDGDSIFVYGGSDEYGNLIKAAYIYNPMSIDSGQWKSIEMASLQYPRLFGSLLKWRDSFVLFGGSDGRMEIESLIKMNIKMSPSESKQITMNKCAECSDEGGVCRFGRQSFAFSQNDNEIHVFGGYRQEVLNDVIVINIDTGEVVHRINYALSIPSLPLKNPPPKYGAAYVSVGSDLMIIGGATTGNIVGNDVWTWNTDLRTWSDTSILRAPIHRTEAAFAKTSESSFVVFGGATQYLDDVLLNDLWQFDTETRKWSVLFAGSSVTGPAPRANGIIYVIGSKVFVVGGRTDIGVYDNNMWSFDMISKTWVIENTNNRLSAYQRPFVRYGIGSAKVGDKVWMWGGQVMPGMKVVEFYSAMMEYDMKQKTTTSDYVGNTIPSRRTYSSMCASQSSNVTMFGGVSPDGSVLDDHWIYDTVGQSWTQMRYESSETSPSMSQVVCGEVAESTILYGKNSKDGSQYILMQQHGFQRQARLYMENTVEGYSRITKHSGAMFGGVMVTFGGTNGFSMTNQVVAYKPGFCSSSQAAIIQSSFGYSVFDDGSGSGMYLENTNCIWILPNATHIIAQKSIREGDSLIIMGLYGEIETTSQSARGGYVEMKSNTGFKVQFVSQGKIGQNVDEACEGCEGFTIIHAACPQYSELNSVSNQCECNAGYHMIRETCYLVTNSLIDEQGTSQNIAPIIGGSVGGVVFLVVVFGLWYRKKVIEDMEKAKSKMYGYIDPKELEYGHLLGSGSFGEVYKGEWRGAEVAIKKILESKVSKKAIESFKAEISVMVELRHPNIVLYMGAVFEGGNLCLVCEFMQHGSLYDILHDDNTHIPHYQRVQFMADICKGMQYLHMSNPPILHRDLKSLNVLVDDRLRLKVSDFGLTIMQGSSNEDENIGSLLWLAPEAIEGKEYGLPADVYSFGIIGWEIMTRKDPYYDVENVLAVTTQVLMARLRPTLEESIPEDIKGIITSAWAQDPLERPAFQQLTKSVSIISEASNITTSSFMRIMNTSDDPPQGEVTLVCTRVTGSEVLWDEIPDAMCDAVLNHNGIVRQLSRKNHGYVSQNDGENFVIVFQEAYDAIKFCVGVQYELQEYVWSETILNHANGKELYEGTLKGLRVQMGLNTGTCAIKKDAVTEHSQYTGKALSSAIKYCRKALGGQILISEQTYQSLQERIGEIQVANEIRPIKASEHDLKPPTAYEVFAKTMKKRAELISKTQHLSYDMEGSLYFSNAETLETMHLPHIPVPVSSETSFKAPSKLPDLGTLKSTGKHVIIDETAFANEGDDMALRKQVTWEIGHSELQMDEKPLGTGSYGTVYTAMYKGSKVAVKKMITQSHKDQYYVGFISEISIMRKLEHANIVKFIGACTKIPNLAIITEVVEKGNLRDFIRNRKNELSAENKYKIVKGISDGMKYLHSLKPPVLHRDLKSANILITDSFEAKICDFGFAKVRVYNRTMTKCGTISYQAPEIMRGERYDEKADVYSFGIILWEIESREQPYSGKDSIAIQFEVMKGLRPDVYKDMDLKMVKLMTDCWNVNSGARPRFEEISGLVEGVQRVIQK